MEMQHIELWCHVSWTEIQDPVIFPWAHKAYFSSLHFRSDGHAESIVWDCSISGLFFKYRFILSSYAHKLPLCSQPSIKQGSLEYLYMLSHQTLNGQESCLLSPVPTETVCAADYPN